VLLQCCCLTGCCRIIAPGIWTRAGSAVSPCGSVGRGTQWDAGPLQLMLGFPSLPPCLQIFTSPLEPAHPTRMPGSPVRPLYHKLEERPVIVSQKFLVEAAEHLRRSKGGLFLASVPAETGTPQPCRTLRSQQWHHGEGHTWLRHPGQLSWELCAQVGQLGCSEVAQKCLGCKCVLLMLCWNQWLRCKRTAIVLPSCVPWPMGLTTKVISC